MDRFAPTKTFLYNADSPVKYTAEVHNNAEHFGLESPRDECVSSYGHFNDSLPNNETYWYAYHETAKSIALKKFPQNCGLPSSYQTNPSNGEVCKRVLLKPPSLSSLRNLPKRSAQSTKRNSSESASHGMSEIHSECSSTNIAENHYEEVKDQRMCKEQSDNRVGISSPNDAIKHELQRVQYNHFRVLDELNLSLEALIMPHHVNIHEHERATGLGTSSSGLLKFPKSHRGRPAASASPVTSPQRKLLIEKLEKSTQPSLKKQSFGYRQYETDEGDMDSGFSGSSNGANYKDSFR